MKNSIYTGIHGDCHIQGIAVDDKNGFIYYSFTTKLIKAKLSGEIVGSVDGLTGHLGCIDFCEDDGKVYGSLEFKNDSIGQGIRAKLGVDTQFDDGFYIAIFDADKITRENMDAEKDGVMTAAYLKDVVDDYHGTGKNKDGLTVPHRYGCSGIDGTAIGPVPGEINGVNRLFVAYGIYSDTDRDDNDNQIILCYDIDELKASAEPLSHENLHKSGPERPIDSFFVYTGNTEYGVQNLEYDSATSSYFMAVYRGKKNEFPNYDLFVADAKTAPVLKTIDGTAESRKFLSLKKQGECEGGIYGYRFPYGSTGLYARGDGTYLISEPKSSPRGESSYIRTYTFNPESGFELKY